MLGTRQWDITRIYSELLDGLRAAVSAYGPDFDAIGIDTWGVDFGFVGRDGTILANPMHYRDHRLDSVPDRVHDIMPWNEIYEATGIQFMQLNSIYQLYSYVESESPLLDGAESILMVSDMLNYMLSGKRACEYTNASTTSLLDPHTKNWHDDLIARLGLPRQLLMDPVEPGTILGNVLPEVARATGLSPTVPIVAAAGHDTASAIAAVPHVNADENWAYLSSGTWSLMGAEIDSPHISEESLAYSFTNEGGVENTIRFLKNIVGLWLIQESRRRWERDGESLDYGTLTQEAAEAEPFTAFIDVDDHSLLSPDDMPEAIRALCRKNGQPEPATHGAVVRCALESLALKYRQRRGNIDSLLQRKSDRLHIIGGGVQNKLLCQMTADACGIPVTAGPVEATAIGNILVQAMATGAVESLRAGREMVTHFDDLAEYTPNPTADWERGEAVLEP
jgi:rhamnulokinase